MKTFKTQTPDSTWSPKGTEMGQATGRASIDSAAPDNLACLFTVVCRLIWEATGDPGSPGACPACWVGSRKISRLTTLTLHRLSALDPYAVRARRRSRSWLTAIISELAPAPPHKGHRLRDFAQLLLDSEADLFLSGREPLSNPARNPQCRSECRLRKPARATVELFSNGHLQRHQLLLRPGGIASHSSIPLGRDI